MSTAAAAKPSQVRVNRYWYDIEFSSVDTLGDTVHFYLNAGGAIMAAKVGSATR